MLLFSFVYSLGLKSNAGVPYIITSCVEWKSHSGFCPGAGTVAASMLSVSLSHSWQGSRGGLSVLLFPGCCPCLKVGRTQSNSLVSSQHFQIQETWHTLIGNIGVNRVLQAKPSPETLLSFLHFVSPTSDPRPVAQSSHLFQR